MNIWFKKLGFYNNPFSIKPAAFNDEIYGYNVPEIINKIDNGEVLFIEGDYGKGKTSILKRIIREFGGKKKVVYYSCNRKEGDIDMEGLLKGGRSFLSKLFNLKSKGMILLLDEAQDITNKDGENLSDYYRGSYFKSIVLVSHNFESLKLAEGIEKLVNDNVVRLGKIEDGDAVNIVRKRIGDADFIDDETIKLIFSKSENNPRRFLKSCEKVCKYAFDMSYDKVRKEHIEKVLN